MENELNEQDSQTRPSAPSTPPIEPKVEQKPVGSIRNVTLLVLMGILLLTFVAGGAYFLGFQKGKSLVPDQNQSTGFGDNQQNIDSENANLTAYQNDKYGFKIEYPASLKVDAVDYDIQKGQRDYIRKCDSGEIDGCGGSRWPDYQVRFQNETKETLFSVNIHVIPVAQFLGGKENNGFTYSVLGFYNDQGKLMSGITDEIIKNIQNSLNFIPTKEPIQCLWTPEFVAVDVNRPGIDKSIYSQASGYYFDQKTQQCTSVSLYHGDGPNIPFQDMQTCITSCAQ